MREFRGEKKQARGHSLGPGNRKILVIGFMTLFLLMGFIDRGAQAEDLGIKNLPPITVAQRNLNPYSYPQQYPQPYPPPYSTPPSDSYSGSSHPRATGWIHVEIYPPDAEVFLDGNKMEPGENNIYDEGVYPGRHKIEAKREGYLGFLEFVNVQPAVKHRLKIRLKALK